MKKCSKCKKHLSRKSFAKDRKNKNGLTNQCRKCRNNYTRIYRAANAEKITTRRRSRRIHAPENAQISSANYRAKAKKAKGELLPKKWLEKCAFFGWKCYLCGKSLSPLTATVDHRKTMSKGGLNVIANVAPCCLRCNSIKGVLPETEARQRIEKIKTTN